MHQMNIVRRADFYLIEDGESGKYFVWRQADLATAEMTRDTLQASWNADALERGKNLHVNFVNHVEQTLFRKS